MRLLSAHITGGVDYDSGPYSVMFTAGMTSVSFDVPINDDNILETNEDFTLTIDSSSLPNGVTRDSVSLELRLYVIAREFVTSLLINLSMGSKQL